MDLHNAAGLLLGLPWVELVHFADRVSLSLPSQTRQVVSLLMVYLAHNQRETGKVTHKQDMIRMIETHNYVQRKHDCYADIIQLTIDIPR